MEPAGPSGGGMAVQWRAATHRGRVRERNEDAHGQFPLPHPIGGRVFAVADGMGGHQAGHVASRLSLEALQAFLEGWASAFSQSADPDAVASGLAAGIREAHGRLLEEGRRDPERTGMGTTMTVAHVKDRCYSFAHVGDSRLYRITPSGPPGLLSRDDGLVAALVRDGTLSEQEARNHPQRNVLVQAVGLDRPLDIQTGTGCLRPGEGLLLCTDGLTNMLTDEEIGSLMKSFPDRPERLVDRANEEGGLDNITVVVVWPHGRRGRRGAGVQEGASRITGATPPPDGAVGEEMEP